jgi:drug/metabolite transporter (DMT)-like permease
MRSAFGTLAVAAAACGWGLWALFLRGSGVAPPWQSVLILGVITLAWAIPALRDGRGRARPLRLWALLGALAVLDAGNYVLFFAAVDRGPIAVAVLTHYLAPVVVAALAPALLAEPLGRRTLPALAVSLGGLALLLAGGPGPRPDPVTALLGAGSALFYGGNTLLAKRLLRDFSVAEVLCWHSALSALLLLPLAGPPPPLHALSGRPLLGALLAGAGGGALYCAGLQRIPAQRAAVLTYAEPLVASLVGALAFGERLGAAGVVGAALIVGGGLWVALQPEPPAAAGLASLLSE